MGAVLTDGVKPLRMYKRIGPPAQVWSVDSKDTKHIKPLMHGWLSYETEFILQWVLKNYDANHVVELGSWYGLSTMRILAMKKGATYGALTNSKT